MSTVFKLIGPNHKIIVEAYDDPQGRGRDLLLSRVPRPAASPARSVATDRSDARLPAARSARSASRGLPKQEEAFSARLSILFKSLQIVRIVDPKRQSLVYMTYSDKLIEGSPKNSITAVPVGKAIPVK